MTFFVGCPPGGPAPAPSYTQRFSRPAVYFCSVMVEPTPKKQKIESLNGHATVSSVTPIGSTPDATSSLMDSLKMTTPITDLYTQQYEITGPSNTSTNSIKISPDGKVLAYCTSSGVIRIHGFENGEFICELTGHTKGINDLDFSPINSNVIASASDDMTVRLWSISKEKCIKILKKHTYHVTTVKFSQKGNILISGSADETITIWDLSSGKNLKTLAAHSDPISSICLTPDNTIIASGSYDGLMRLFDCETGQCLKTLVFNSSSYGTATASTNDVVNPPISYVEYSPNGKYILSSSLDGVIRLWDYMNNKVIKTYLGPDNQPIGEKFICGTKFVTCTLDPLIVSGSDSGRLLVWNVQSKDIIYKDVKIDDAILEVDLYEGGKKLAFCGRNGVIRVMSVNNKYVNTEF